MTATAAKIGYGVTFAIGNGDGPPETFGTALAELTNVVPPGLTRETVDATSHASANRVREFISGLRAGGDVTLDLNYVPGGTAWTALKAKYDLDTPVNYKITFPNASTVIFPGLITDLSPATPMADKMTLAVKIKPTGAPTWA